MSPLVRSCPRVFVLWCCGAIVLIPPSAQQHPRSVNNHRVSRYIKMAARLVIFGSEVRSTVSCTV